jgi:uncharacterized SAM-binding protein YcdF (DUF218 family)
MMRRKIWIIAILLSAFLAFSYAGRLLVVNQSPVKSDAIILLTGGGIERLTKSVELFQKGLGCVLLISNASEDGLYSAAIQSGVPSKNIVKETKADSTYKNAWYTFQIMKKYKFQSAIVVSSDYHMRRVKFNFDQVYNHSGIRLTYCAAASGFRPNQWYLSSGSIQTVFNEYVKLAGNALGFNGNVVKEPLREINDALFQK